MNWLDRLCAVFDGKEILTVAEVARRSGQSPTNAACGLPQLVKSKRLWRIGRGQYSRVYQRLPISPLEQLVLAAFGPHSFATAKWLRQQVPMSHVAFRKVMNGLLKKGALYTFQRGVYTIKSPFKGGITLPFEIKDTL